MDTYVLLWLGGELLVVLAGQVMLKVAPAELFAEMWSRFLAGSLMALALDPAANFVVQAALAATQEPAQVHPLHVMSGWADLLSAA